MLFASPTQIHTELILVLVETWLDLGFGGSKMMMSKKKKQYVIEGDTHRGARQSSHNELYIYILLLHMLLVL